MFAVMFARSLIQLTIVHFILFAFLCPIEFVNAGERKSQVLEVVNGISPSPPDIRLPNQQELISLEYSLRGLNDYKGSYFRISNHERALKILATTYGPKHPVTAQFHYLKADQHISIQEYDIAEFHLDQAKRIFQERLEKNAPQHFWIGLAELSLLDANGQQLRHLERLNQLDALLRKLRPNDSDLAALFRNQLATVMYRLGRFKEAVDIDREELEAKLASEQTSRNSLIAAVAGHSLTLLANGQLREAEALLEKHGDISELHPDHDRYVIATVHRTRAEIMMAKLDYDGAKKELQSAYDIYSAKKHRLAGSPKKEPGNPYLANQVEITPDFGTFAATRTAIKSEILRQKKTPNPSFPNSDWPSLWIKVKIGDKEQLSTQNLSLGEPFEITNRVQALYAKSLALRGEKSIANIEKVEPFWQSLLQFYKNGYGPKSVTTAAARLDLANHYLKINKPLSAQIEAETAFEIFVSNLDQSHPLIVRAQTVLTKALIQQGLTEQAESRLERTIESVAKSPDLTKSELLELLIEKDRMLRRDDDITSRYAFWKKWIPSINNLNIRGSVGDLENFGQVFFLMTQAEINAVGCPQKDFSQNIDQMAKSFRFQQDRTSKPIILPDVSKFALTIDRVKAEILACDEKNASELFAFINDLEKSRIHASAKEKPAETLARADRWANLLMLNPQFGVDKELTDLVFSLIGQSGMIARNQIFLSRNASGGTENQIRRALATQGAGLEYRFALDTQMRAHAIYQEVTQKKSVHRKVDSSPVFASQDDGFDATFQAAQMLRIDRNSQTLSLASARAAAPNTELREAVSKFQDLSADLAFILTQPNPDEDNLKKVRAEYTSLDSEIQEKFPRYYEFAAPAPLRFWEVRSALNEGESLLTLVPSGEDIYVFAQSKSFRKDRAWHRVKGGVEKVENLVAYLRCDIDPVECGAGSTLQSRSSDSISDSDWIGFEFDRNKAWELYNLLLGPVAHVFEQQLEYEEPTRKIYAVTSGAISALPLSVLLTKPPVDDGINTSGNVFRDAPWLSDRFDISYLPSVSDLTGSTRTNISLNGFSGYGDPVLGPPGKDRSAGIRGELLFQDRVAQSPLANPSALKKLASLPGSEAELAAIAELFPNQAKVRTKLSATETAIKNDPQIAGSSIVAFSTHGLLPDTKSGIAEPGLVMTPPSKATIDDDGLLSASEAAALDLTSELLILSACNTATAGSFEGSDSLSGLARSFVFAGAQNVYASHWRVSDNITKELILLAVKNALEDRSLTRSEALNLAMKMIRSGEYSDGTAIKDWNLDWSHPSSWAPFVTITSLNRTAKKSE